MTQPCSGFDAAVSYLCIQIENRMHENHTTFDETLGMIMKTEDDLLLKKIKHINEKYNRSIDEICDRIIEYHKDW